MKPVIVVNIINVMILLVLVVLLLFDIPKFIVYILIAIWGSYAVYSNYQLILKQNDIIASLKASAKGSYFEAQITRLSKVYNAISNRQDFYSRYEEGDSIRSAYDLLQKQIASNIVQATNYIKHYDYITKPRTTYLDEIVRNSNELLTKSIELSELVLQIEDSTSDVDTTYVDDMLESLRKVVKDEEQ